MIPDLLSIIPWRASTSLQIARSLAVIKGKKNVLKEQRGNKHLTPTGFQQELGMVILLCALRNLPLVLYHFFYSSIRDTRSGLELCPAAVPASERVGAKDARTVTCVFHQRFIVAGASGDFGKRLFQ